MIPPIQTQRLTIRNFSQDDLWGFYALIEDKEASPYAVFDHPFPKAKEDLKKF